jgi:programmed cell death 6-interacting protein
MKELTKAYGDLLQDKRVRSEQSKYETITRQRNTVMARYKKVYNAFRELVSGLSQAQSFYAEMRETVDSLRKNVDTFVSNRRSEGAQLLSQIERDKASSASGQDDREREKLRQLMERLSTEPAPSSSSPPKQRPAPPAKVTSHSSGTRSPPVPSPHYPSATPVQHAPILPPSQAGAPFAQYIPSGTVPVAGTPYYPVQQPFQQGAATPLSEGYNPMAYPYQTPVSPPPNQQFFSATTPAAYGYPPSGTPIPPSHTPQFIPQGYIPPPPPPRPQQTSYPPTTGPYPSGPGGYAQSRPYGTSQHSHKVSQSHTQPQASPHDPWAGLNAWK